MSTRPDISFVIPVRRTGASLERSMLFLEEALKQTAHSYEVILVPNHDVKDNDSITERLCFEMANSHEQIRVVPHSGTVGKGAALRTGFQAAVGNWVFFTDADLPYHVKAIEDSIRHLQAGIDFVSANRRIVESKFVCSIQVLRFVYRRHLLGLLFNRVARLLFGLKTSDTQAGFKAFSRPLINRIIALQTCPGFLSDLEYFLICQDNDFTHREIPVKFYLLNEKSTVRIFRETKTSLYWFAKLFIRRQFGWYRSNAKIQFSAHHSG